jgi:hypothetical protein
MCALVETKYTQSETNGFKLIELDFWFCSSFFAASDIQPRDDVAVGSRKKEALLTPLGKLITIIEKRGMIMAQNESMGGDITGLTI